MPIRLYPLDFIRPGKIPPPIDSLTAPAPPLSQNRSSGGPSPNALVPSGLHDADAAKRGVWAMRGSSQALMINRQGLPSSPANIIYPRGDEGSPSSCHETVPLSTGFCISNNIVTNSPLEITCGLPTFNHYILSRQASTPIGSISLPPPWFNFEMVCGCPPRASTPSMLKTSMRLLPLATSRG